MDMKIAIRNHKIVTTSTVYIGCMILLPILNQYKILSMNFFDVVNIGVFIVCTIKKVKLKLKSEFLPYVFYTLITSIFLMTELRATTPVLLIKNIVSFLLMIFNVYFIAVEYFDLVKAYKIYSKVIIVLSVIVVIEFFINLLFGIRLVLAFPWATLNYGDGIMGSTYISLVQNTYSSYRASAFFLEPASFAGYALPWLFLSLFNINRKNSLKNFFLVLFISMSICLTTSSLGILGVLIAWCAYVEVSLFNSGRKKLLVTIPILLCVGIYVYNLDIVQAQIMSKMYSMNDLSRSTSLSLRLLRGKYCFEELDNIHQIFGCGYGVLYQYFMQNNISTVLDRADLVVTYMNGMSLMFCSVGIIGSVLYLIPFIGKVVSNKSVFMLFACWMLLQMTSQVFDTPTLLLLTIFIIVISKKNIKEIRV
ncbi:MAG: hypothetical protein RR139_04630 [Lachnospiraceae bacterium]